MCSLLLSIETPNDVLVSSLTVMEYSSNLKGSDQTAFMRRLIEALLVSHTILVEISCHGSKNRHEWNALGNVSVV